MQNQTAISHAERRADERVVGGGSMRVTRTMPVLPLGELEVLNVSPQGVAVKSPVPMEVGQRLSFSRSGAHPPILAEVLACEPVDEGVFRLRCRCLLGAFDLV